MEILEPGSVHDQSFELIIVGSGFASIFFLEAYLRLRASSSSKILIIERGSFRPHSWQLKNIGALHQQGLRTFTNLTPQKEWVYTPAIGGGSNCWWGCTPRMTPGDFKLNSLWGIGLDWPISYDELEKHYLNSERIMEISGPDNTAIFPRSAPYPQPPHIMSEPDRLLKRAFPHQFFEQPTARARVSTRHRVACCGTGVCGLCPVDAKFTVLNELQPILNDPRISILPDAEVVSIEHAGSLAQGLVYYANQGQSKVRSDLIVLGANALFNAAILLRTGLSHAELGKGVNEQVSKALTFDLTGIQSFGGSTSITGHGYMLYDAPRKDGKAGALLEIWNVPNIRLQKNRWRERLMVKAIFEDFRRTDNLIRMDGDEIVISHHGHSIPTQQALAQAEDDLLRVLRPLPIEKIVDVSQSRTEGHIIGTTIMHTDPARGVVDRTLKLHSIRNVLALGSGVFPTCSPANPTLTICALSQWAASNL